jgi:16S rRNA A1518/A1519 N6-dimethyltransferase RsmA/KsgA/DIM1 with predicted DNA glycosylase/AP lyase activity
MSRSSAPRLGQHFLADPEAARRIAAAADIRPGDRVLEIGPGRGALTEPLLAAGAVVTAVEMDRELAAELKAGAAPGRLAVIQADFLKLDLDSLLPPPADRSEWREYVDQLRAITEGLPPTLLVLGMTRVINITSDE